MKEYVVTRTIKEWTVVSAVNKGDAIEKAKGEYDCCWYEDGKGFDLWTDTLEAQEN